MYLKTYCLNRDRCLHVLELFSVRSAVAQLVEALRYKSEGRGLDSRWCHWNFLLT